MNEVVVIVDFNLKLLVMERGIIIKSINVEKVSGKLTREKVRGIKKSLNDELREGRL